MKTLTSTKFIRALREVSSLNGTNYSAETLMQTYDEFAAMCLSCDNHGTLVYTRTELEGIAGVSGV